jgi:hypothetical protein
VLTEDKKVEEACLPLRLPRTRNSMHLSRLHFLDMLYFTSTDGSTPRLTPSRSSSSSGEEVVFRGRTKHRRDISIERVLEALGGLSVTENEVKNKGSHDDVGPHTSGAYSISQKGKQPSYDSGDVRRLITKGIRPSPAEDLETERDNPYSGIDLNKGWNRASLRGVKHFFAARLLISNKIASDFAGFSLKAQQLLLPVRPDLQKLFTFAFKSTGPVNKPFHTCRSLVLSRRTLQPISSSSPPSWFQPGSYNLSNFTADVLGHQVFLFDLPPEPSANSAVTSARLVPWHGGRKRSFHDANLSTAKSYLSEKHQCLYLCGRHIHHQNSHLAPSSKRNRLVVDHEWRKRMRSRAVRGGRWSDGTPRQDRLWAEFHWVLDGGVEEDPVGQKRAFSE